MKKRKFSYQEASEYHSDKWASFDDDSNYYYSIVKKFRKQSDPYLLKTYESSIKSDYHLYCSNMISQKKALLTKEEKRSAWRRAVKRNQEIYKKDLDRINKEKKFNSVLKKVKR